MSIKDYAMVCGETPAKLASAVKVKLKAGWQIYGHPLIEYDNSANTNFYQSMVLHKTERELIGEQYGR